MSTLAELERAFAYDRDGFETEAIPHYEAAIAGGLPDELLAKALLGLGSSLRNVARADEAVDVLAGAVTRFPAHGALGVFYGLALWSTGRRAAALTAVEDALDRRGGLDGYDRAIRAYLSELER